MMKGKYLVQNSFLYIFLKTMDLIFSLFWKKKLNKERIYNPKRILLCNIAHFGDVVIATSILPVLKKAFPRCKIGFLLGSWSFPILERHHFIDWIHQVDHWKLNRRPVSKLKKIRRYISTWIKAYREIRRNKYDVAIDLYYFFPNSIFLLWAAKIPRRIGYVSGGGGPLLTDSFFWKNKNQYVSTYYIQLLEVFSINFEIDKHLQICLPKPREIDESSLKKKMKRELFSSFIILHVGSANPLKLWTDSNWKKLCKELEQIDQILVFTGKGNEENNRIKNISKGLKSYINLCDQLNWQELICLVKHAKFVISIDSVITHIAAGHNINTIILSHGLNNRFHWISKQNSLGIIHEKHCVPCFKKEGCKDMQCIRNISYETVFQLAKEIVFSSKTRNISK